MESRLEKNKNIEKEIKKEKNSKKRKLIYKILIIIFIILIIIFLLIRFIGTSFIKTKEYMIKDDIPSSYNGIKILHFSDIYYKTTINKKDLNKLEKEFKRIKPDIIIFTGDITNKTLDGTDIEDLSNFFTNIEAPLGKYSIKGDNDNTTFDLIMDKSNFTILENNYKLLYFKDNNPICITNGNVNLDKIKSYYKITLIHNFDEYNFDYESNIVLSGHTLNGELYVPYYKGIFNTNKYYKSNYTFNDTNVFINNGLGSKHYLRMFNHPSINVYRLIKN